MRFEKKIAPLLKKREDTRRLFKKLLSEAKGEKSQDEIESLRAEAYHEDRNHQFEIDWCITSQLTAEAQRLFIPVPSRDDEKIWNESALGGDPRKYLSDHGISFLRDGIREEQKKRREVRIAYFEVAVKFVTILTGLIGASIGLVSILKN